MTTPPDLVRAVANHPRGSTISLIVAPRSSINRLEWQQDGTLRLRITAPPVDGAANAALLKYLSRTLGIAASRLSIDAGERGRRKRIVVEGLEADDLTQRLEAALA